MRHGAGVCTRGVDQSNARAERDSASERTRTVLRFYDVTARRQHLGESHHSKGTHHEAVQGGAGHRLPRPGPGS